MSAVESNGKFCFGFFIAPSEGTRSHTLGSRSLRVLNADLNSGFQWDLLPNKRVRGSSSKYLRSFKRQLLPSKRIQWVRVLDTILAELNII